MQLLMYGRDNRKERLWRVWKEAVVAMDCVVSDYYLTTCCTTYYNTNTMLKTYLYIPDELEAKINLTARVQNKSKAEVMRQALEEGINTIKKQQYGGAETLLKLAEIGKKFTLKGVHDSSRMDELLWGKDWSKDE